MREEDEEDALRLMKRDPSLTLEGAHGLLTQFRDLEAEGAPITRNEMKAMFGEEIPVVAVALLWDMLGEMTVGQVRARLRGIAAANTVVDTV